MKATPPTNRPPFNGAATPQGGHLHKAREVDQPQDNTPNENQNERSVKTDYEALLKRAYVTAVALRGVALRGVALPTEAVEAIQALNALLQAVGQERDQLRADGVALVAGIDAAIALLEEAERLEAEDQLGRILAWHTIRDTLAILRGDA